MIERPLVQLVLSQTAMQDVNREVLIDLVI